MHVEGAVSREFYMAFEDPVDGVDITIWFIAAVFALLIPIFLSGPDAEHLIGQHFGQGDAVLYSMSSFRGLGLEAEGCLVLFMFRHALIIPSFPYQYCYYRNNTVSSTLYPIQRVIV